MIFLISLILIILNLQSLTVITHLSRDILPLKKVAKKGTIDRIERVKLQRWSYKRNIIMENADGIQSKQYGKLKLRIIQYSIDLNSYKVPLAVVILLIIIQSVQLISIGVVTPIAFHSFGLSWFKKIAQVLFPEYYLRSTRLVMYIVPICFLLSAFHAFLLVYTFKKSSRLKIIVHYLFVIFNSITVVLFALMNVSTLVCISGNPFSHNFQCFSGIHILYFILALLNTVWLLFCVFFVLLFYVNPNPFSYQYFTCSSNLWMAGKFLIKVAPVIFLVIDPFLQFDVLYIVSFAGINLVNFIAFKIMWPYFINHRFISNFVMRFDLLVIIVVIFFIPLRFLYEGNQNNSVFLVSLLLGFIFGQFVIEIFSQKKKRLLDIFIDTEQKQEESEKYQQFFYDLIYKIEHRQQQKPLLICLLKLHEKECKDSECSCKSVAKAYLKQENYNLSDDVIYKFINMLIEGISSTMKNKINLKLISGFISYYKLNKKIKSIHLLSELLNNNKISLREEISIRKLHFKFKFQGNSVTVLNKYREFSEFLWEFQRKAETAINNCRKYWIQLIQQDCEISKIWRMANIVQKDKENLDYIINEKLLKIFPNNLHILRLYSQLLSSVYRVPYYQVDKYLSAFQLASNLPQQFPENKQKILFRENQKMSVMCAAENEGIFQFIRVNSNIIQIFQTRSVDFLHKNINLIIPEIYQQFHDKKIKQYLFRSDENIKERNGKIFVIDANHNLVHCVYKVKILFSQKYGLQFVCFIRKINTDGPKKKFMSYVIDQSIEKDNVKHYKKGDVIHIDAQLKQFFFGEQSEEYNENYYGKIQDLLPQWNIEKQKMMLSDENQSNLQLFNKIQLIQTDQLQEGINIKYIAFTYRIQVPRLTIQPIRETSSFTRRQSNLRDSFWSQTSHSRLNLLDTNEKNNCQPNNFISNKKPFPLSQKAINTISIAIVCVLVIISVLIFSLGFEQKKIQKQDFQIIQLSNSISKILSGISIEIKQQISKLSGKIFFDSTLLQIVNQNVKRIYGIIGNQYIDSRFFVNISIYQNNQLKSQSSYTFNNAVSFLVSTGLLLQGRYSIEDLNNFFKNLKPILEACFSTASVSIQFVIQKSKNIANREIAFNCIQGFIVTVLTVFLIFRIFTIYSFSYSTIIIYQNSLEISQLKEFVRKCSKFAQKVKGEYQLVNSEKKQKVKMIVMQLQHLVPQQPLRISYGQNDNQIENDQRKKLLQMRKLITFQEQPTRLNYIVIGLIIFFIYLVAKININFSNLNINFEKEKYQKRQFINMEYQLASRLQILLSEFASKSLLHESDLKFHESLISVQNLLTKLSSTDKQLIKQIDLLKIYQVITQLKSDSQVIQFLTLKRDIIACQQNLFNHSQKDMISQIQKTSPRRSGLFLALEIFIILFVTATLWKLISQQEQIRIGCALMMSMLGESEGEKKMNQDKSLISLNASMKI